MYQRARGKKFQTRIDAIFINPFIQCQLSLFAGIIWSWRSWRGNNSYPRFAATLISNGCTRLKIQSYIILFTVTFNETVRAQCDIKRIKNCRSIPCIAGWLKNRYVKPIEVIVIGPDKREINVPQPVVRSTSFSLGTAALSCCFAS